MKAKKMEKQGSKNRNSTEILLAYIAYITKKISYFLKKNPHEI